jgi:hypothetical protein
MGVASIAIHPVGSEKMADDMSNLIGPDETAFRLDLTAAQLKVTWTALKIYFDDLGHEEHDVRSVVGSVLEKLPNEHEIRAIDLGREMRRKSA